MERIMRIGPVENKDLAVGDVIRKSKRVNTRFAPTGETGQSRRGNLVFTPTSPRDGCRANTRFAPTGEVTGTGKHKAEDPGAPNFAPTRAGCTR